MDILSLTETQLKKDEGFQQHIYVINGVRHIGYGFNLDDVGIYPEEADFILANRVKKLFYSLCIVLPWFKTLSTARQAVLLNMAYMAGLEGLMGFRDFLRASEEGKWQDAATALLDSKAHYQNPARMERLAYQWEMDKM